MLLNHINLPVPDVATTAAFLRSFFGLSDFALRPTPVMALLTDGHGNIINISNFERVAEVSYPSSFHIGFLRSSREEVDAVYGQLTEAGYTASKPRSFHGSWTFYVEAPGGFTVEVQHFERLAA